MKKKLLFMLFISSIIIFSMSCYLYAKQAQIEGENLNVRNGPGTEYEVIAQVNPPDTYRIIEEVDEWIKIELATENGWIHKDYAQIVEKEMQESEENEKSTTTTQASPTTSEIKDFHSSVSDLNGKIIVIDPGHGGIDVGAIGASGGYESNYTLKTSFVLKEMLEAHGAKVYLTRNKNYYVSLTSRTTYSGSKFPDVFLSLHYNSTPELPDVKGVGTYYYSDTDQSLAKYVHKGILSQTGMNDRGVVQEDLQVLRMNHRPSLLLELGFLSNREEESHLRSNVFLESMSRGIIMGLYDYFNK
ncbi:N-acetylmuramoyl-L-alanine amidase [Gracilibacillus dipsosauri]|uniref:N-acetylmuramoyl-L-alanine amidase n=1 Tax=Gracilibacillus dipsosauri TaxID=178340 RepID=A0A317L0K4_9BACI|nr:N-acetylmuramoyl-L-alanine amidase [Gracilibacillus dipsosauri]PWU68378.1 N-acetylmuramoyl-L-alanine amidase [Gracilibacillus dipsosauri]